VEERKVERVQVDGMELHVDPVDDDGGDDKGPHTALPPRVESWRRRSVAGAVLSGFAFGLKEALEPERQEAPIIVQVSGDPVDDLPVEAHLDDLQPSESVVTVRPWLLKEIAAEGGPAEGGPAEGGPAEGGPAEAPPKR
jgi:hypothetical protein